MLVNNFVSVHVKYEKYPSYRDTFKKLRSFWGITETYYRKELSKSTIVIGKGKSKMKMWISKTKYFYIKELTVIDDQSLKGVLDQYVKYILANKGSLLPKIYGIYKKNNISYIVQKNLNPYTTGTWLYDLKGARRTRINKSQKINDIGQDNNLGDSQLWINNSVKIKNQIKKDTDFLATNNLVDYSLLICMKTSKVTNVDWNCWGVSYIKGPGPCKPTKINLNMGIIDILQKYNTQKKIESYLKSPSLIQNRSSSNVTIINSIAYKKRFDKYITNLIKNKK